ncbi:MAG: PIG-L family deacetylase [Syntrophobacter sp.]
MKQTLAALMLFLGSILLIAAECSGQESFATEYLRQVSMFSPVAGLSAKDLIEGGNSPRDPAPSRPIDPFTYIPHKPLDVPSGVRAMIFIPHPDDEAIAASGLIQRIVEKEGKVCVVFVTNGDGYKEAVRLRVRNANISAKDFIEYGKKRQEEAVLALCELGLRPEDALFLGFPDDGIDDLWESYWSNLKPFISPHTLFDRPHRKGFNRWVKYSGVDLNQEIARLLTEFSPDWVILPDPRDHHPDHATTGVFVLGGLQTIYQGGKAPFTPTQVLTYLVHFKDYPHDGEWAKEIGASGINRCSTSGKTLANAGWVTLPLSPEEVEGKRRALLAHSSQLQMLHGFFKNFLLPCEIYGSLNLMQVISVPLEYAAYFNHPAPYKQPEPPESPEATDEKEEWSETQ